jgi:transposase
LFEAVVIDWLWETEQISAVVAMMHLSWDEADGIRARAVARGLARRGKAPLPAAIGVDETSFRKGHEYVTVVNSLAEPLVLDVVDERKQSSLDAFYRQYTPEELSRIEYVAMDMWEPYIASTHEHLTDAASKIVFDKFHVLQHRSGAVDQVRRQENKRLREAGDDRLKRTKYLWLRRSDRLDEEDRVRLDALATSSLAAARALGYKELASSLWGYARWVSADKAWRRWLHGALRCSLEPVKRVARMIQGHLQGVVNAAASDITNAMSESNNSNIQRIKKRARGFRSRARFRIAILFHLGGLDLYPRPTPATHTIPGCPDFIDQTPCR